MVLRKPLHLPYLFYFKDGETGSASYGFSARGERLFVEPLLLPKNEAKCENRKSCWLHWQREGVLGQNIGNSLISMDVKAPVGSIAHLAHWSHLGVSDQSL